MDIPDDEINAIRYFIRKVDFAGERFPDEPIKAIFQCACLGPRPGHKLCPCQERAADLAAFMERTKAE